MSLLSEQRNITLHVFFSSFLLKFYQCQEILPSLVPLSFNLAMGHFSHLAVLVTRVEKEILHFKTVSIYCSLIPQIKSLK